MILIIAGNYQEAKDFVDMMGFVFWVNVDHYRAMLRHRCCSVYIVGTGAERADFPAIEGLFLMGGHTVMDMNE